MFFFANFCLHFLPSQEIAAIILPSDSLVTTTSFYFTPSEVDRMEISYKKLWKLLIDRDLKKKDLERQAGISHYTMHKLLNGDNVTTETLGKICKALGCTVDDIMEITFDEEVSE